MIVFGFSHLLFLLSRRAELMQEVMDLFVVESELELLNKQHLQSKPPVPQRPDNLDFASGPIELRPTMY